MHTLIEDAIMHEIWINCKWNTRLEDFLGFLPMTLTPDNGQRHVETISLFIKMAMVSRLKDFIGQMVLVSAWNSLLHVIVIVFGSIN